MWTATSDLDYYAEINGPEPDDEEPEIDEDLVPPEELQAQWDEADRQYDMAEEERLFPLPAWPTIVTPHRIGTKVAEFSAPEFKRERSAEVA